MLANWPQQLKKRVFCFSLQRQPPSHTLSGWKSGRGLRGLHKVPLSVSKVQVVTTWGAWMDVSLWDLIRCIPESWGNWLMSLPSLSPWYVKSHDSQVKSPVTGKEEPLYPSPKRVQRRTLGATDPSVSPLCLGKSWNRSSLRPCWGTWRTGRWSGLHQGQVLPDQPSGLL